MARPAWYTSAWLFRQTRAGEWGGVFDAIAAPLRVEVAERRSVSLTELLGKAIAPGDLMERAPEKKGRRG